jgi:hypothetical protein
MDGDEYFDLAIVRDRLIGIADLSLPDHMFLFVQAMFSSRFWVQNHYAKRRFSITLKCWYMHGVLNVDEIKS